METVVCDLIYIRKKKITRMFFWVEKMGRK